jgi:hypothetical protein
MNNAINLLPCPMCGCNSIAIKNEQPADNSGGYFIECPDCGTSTSLRYACGDDPMPLLAEQWNRRTSTQHQIAAPAQDARTAFEAISRFMKCEWSLDWDPAGFYDDAKTDAAFTWFEQGYMRAQQAAAPQATPFMWAIQEPGGGAYMDDSCVSSVREDVQAEVDGLNSGLDADDDPYQVVPVYLAAAALAEVHPDDAAVDALAALMKAKLAEKRANGYGGWNDKTQCPQQRLSDMLRAHVDKGDPVDVANFCAMLSARGEGISQPVAKNLTAPSVSPADVESAIDSEHYYTGQIAAETDGQHRALGGIMNCTLVMKNGHLVNGEALLQDLSKPDPERAMASARRRAFDKAYDMVVYAERQRLAGAIQTVAQM